MGDLKIKTLFIRHAYKGMDLPFLGEDISKETEGTA